MESILLTRRADTLIPSKIRGRILPDSFGEPYRIRTCDTLIKREINARNAPKGIRTPGLQLERLMS